MPLYYTSRKSRYFARPAMRWSLLAVCLVCWTVSFWQSIGYPVYVETTDTPLWSFICNHLPGKWATYLIGLILLSGGAFLLNKLNYELTLVSGSAKLPLLLYLLFVSTNEDFLPMKSTSVGVFCLIGAMYQLFTSYHDPESREKAYSAALLIGVGSLLWVYLLWFLPLFWIGMYRFRSLTKRTLTASLLGVVTVYWLLGGWCFWQKDYVPLLAPLAALTDLHLFSVERIGFREWAGLFLIALLAVCASLRILLVDESSSIRSRQFLAFLVCMFVWNVALYFLYKNTPEEFMETACISASLLVAHLFSAERGKLAFYTFVVAMVSLVFIFINRIWNFL